MPATRKKSPNRTSPTGESQSLYPSDCDASSPIESLLSREAYHQDYATHVPTIPNRLQRRTKGGSPSAIFPGPLHRQIATAHHLNLFRQVTGRFSWLADFVRNPSVGVLKEWSSHKFPRKPSAEQSRTGDPCTVQFSQSIKPSVLSTIRACFLHWQRTCIPVAFQSPSQWRGEDVTVRLAHDVAGDGVDCRFVSQPSQCSRKVLPNLRATRTQQQPMQPGDQNAASATTFSGKITKSGTNLSFRMSTARPLISSTTSKRPRPS